jgi:hypothetical protein
MKKALATLAIASIAVSAFSQGQINFHNLIGGSGATSIRAPIFGPEGNNPNSMDQRQGQPPLASGSPFPVGTTTYTGDRLSGTGFTAELWAGALGTADSALTAVPTGGRVSSFQSGNAAGYFTAGVTAVIDGVNIGQAARLQVRAWDNRGGTVTSWAAVMANPTVLRGWSTAFDSLTLGGGTTTPPNMVGLTSFNLFVPVPEPSVIALGALGLGALLFRRFRK